MDGSSQRTSAKDGKEAIQILDKYNHPYDIVYTNFVGTILYEDEWQVAVKVENGQMV